MKITKTSKTNQKNLVMLVYGLAGVGKTTFGASSPKPLLLDFENGGKFLGNRGIEIDVINIHNWISKEEKIELSKQINDYESIIIDPLGEAMEQLIKNDVQLQDRKNRQSDGTLTMAGWGKAKELMRDFIKWLKSTGKNIIIISHVTEENDNGIVVKRPKVQTKLSEELIGMVDIVGYFYTEKSKRLIYVGGSDERVVAKDRTEMLKPIMNADFNEFLGLVNNGVIPTNENETKAQKILDELNSSTGKMTDEQFANHVNSQGGKNE